jgi:hypothetical protein
MTSLKNPIRSRLAFALMAASFATVVGASVSATATPSYDGLWSVVIITEKGTCDRAYRYPVRISKGTLENAGGDSFVITGKVAGSGAVTVTVSHGDKSANGSGRLSGAAGAGTWSTGSCAGTWEAERRG